MPPRRRPKNRLDHIVDALEGARAISGSLQSIDLRTTSGELRDLLRTARTLSSDLGQVLYDAIQADVPTSPLARK